MKKKLLLAATIVSLSGVGVLTVVHGATLEEQIAALLAQIANLQTQLAAPTPLTS
ncbi:MAG: hypothetical protein HYY86_00975 [Candidatus Harrisonbacteria bacterium]|nr:hypothetical protein [Candidatus Harrisonbacteria bacterium]